MENTYINPAEQQNPRERPNNIAHTRLFMT